MCISLKVNVWEFHIYTVYTYIYDFLSLSVIFLSLITSNSFFLIFRSTYKSLNNVDRSFQCKIPQFSNFICITGHTNQLSLVVLRIDVYLNFFLEIENETIINFFSLMLFSYLTLYACNIACL